MLTQTVYISNESIYQFIYQQQLTYIQVILQCRSSICESNIFLCFSYCDVSQFGLIATSGNWSKYCFIEGAAREFIVSTFMLTSDYQHNSLIHFNNIQKANRNVIIIAQTPINTKDRFSEYLQKINRRFSIERK